MTRPAWPANPGGATPAIAGCVALRLLLPEQMAMHLAGEDSGIACRAGVKLAFDHGRGADGAPPTLVVEGTPLATALACYLVQKALWMEAVLRPH